MIYIHDNEVKKIAEFNLLHDIINPPKRAKKINSHYYPIIHVCMNTRKGRANFKNFQIILDSGCNPTVLMGRIVENYTLKNMLWCSGKHRPKTSLLILSLKWNLPYLDSAQQM